MGTARIITVSIIEHRDTGLLVGLSDDLKGLYVHGRSEDEIVARIPIAIREVLEAEGRTNISVMAVEEDEVERIPSAFERPLAIRKFALAAQQVTNEEYRVCVKALGLTPMKPSFDGATMHQDRDGNPVRVIDPEELSEAERKAMIDLIKLRLGIIDNQLPRFRLD